MWAVTLLESLGIVNEVTGLKKNCSYSYQNHIYLQLR